MRTEISPFSIYAGMAELADAPVLGAGGFTVQVRPLLPAPEKDLNFDKKLRSFSMMFAFGK